MQIFRSVDIAVLIKMFKENKNSLSSPNNWPDHWEKLDIEIKNKQESLQFIFCNFHFSLPACSG